MREIRTEQRSRQNLSLSDILSMSNNIMHINKELIYLSEPKNAASLCIILDGLDEYPPAYNDPNNYIYKIIVGQQLSSATVIVLSRPEAYESFFVARGGFQTYELAGFNSEGIKEYVTRNILDQEHAERFLSYLEKKPTVYQLCTFPLHLTMFVESMRGESEFPLTLKEAYAKSISKSFKREIRRQKPVGCSNVRLSDLSSVRLCNPDLADTIINASRLAFDGLLGHDRDVQFSVAQLHTYLPSGDNYGLLSPSCQKNQDVKSVCSYSFQHILFPVCASSDNDAELDCSFSFPHSVVQEFWAAFHVTIVKKTISDVEQHIVTHTNFLYFVCGSNIAILNDVFETLIQWHIINDYTTCGIESGHSIQSLADTYLKFHDTALSLDNLSPFSPHFVQAQYFFETIHINITHIFFTDSSESLRPYMKNRTNIFPNLEKVTIVTHLIHGPDPTDFYCSFDFKDNLRLLFNRETSLSKLEWILPLKYLIDRKFLNCLDEIFVTEIIEMKAVIIGSFVEVPQNLMNMYKSCHSESSIFFSAVKLTPETFITALEKFTNFFQPDKIRIEYTTPVSCLECQQIETVFEALYNSPIYIKVQSFEMDEVCSILSVDNIPLPYDKTSGIARIEQSNIREDHSSNKRTLYLTSGLICENWRMVTNFYFRLGLISKSHYSTCTSRQMHTYSET